MSDNPRTFWLSREEVYELVWTTPIQKLAREWGLSDVGLAKVLKRIGVPRPGRGYWARVAAGQRVKRTPLSQASKYKDDGVRVFRSPLADVPEAPEPIVQVPDRLVDPHEVTQLVAFALKDIAPDHNGLLRLGSRYCPAVIVKPRTRPRAVRILDALVKALIAAGHEVVVTDRFERSRFEVVVRADDRGIALCLEEIARLVRSPNATANDDIPITNPRRTRTTGNLRLSLGSAPYSYRKRKSWSDTDSQSLEDLLGKVVVSVGEAVVVARHEEQERKREAHERLIENRRAVRGERLDWYSRWLADDLVAMSKRWHRAQRLRAFLDAYEQRMPLIERDERAAVWLATARRYVDGVDPLTHANHVAKDMELSDEELEELIESSKRGGRAE